MEITESCGDRKRKNVDRLSSLMDDILIHILSFLPTKIYVATSVLGRRWRFLWARVPNLDFDEEVPYDGRVSSIINNRVQPDESEIQVLGLKLDTPTLQYLKFNNCVPQDYSEVPRFAFFASAEKFRNLIDIELEADWRFIPILLQKADNLEVLTIRSYNGEFNPTYWISPEQAPACLVSHLRTIRICGFGCTEQEFNVVRYFLWNAKVLRWMKIYTAITDLNKQVVALKKISLFPRDSVACRVNFVEMSVGDQGLVLN